MPRATRQKKQRIRSVEITGWQTDLMIIIGGAKHEAKNAYMERWGYDPEPEMPGDHTSDGAFFGSPDGRACALWLPGVPRTPYELANLAHESTHAANHILCWCGVEYTVHTDSDGYRWVNDEPWTYLIASIFETALTFARETK